jgi:hypothetical protein
MHNKQARELAMDSDLMGHLRKENSVTWLVVCSKLNTLNCTIFSAPWDLGEVLVHHVICGSGPCVTPCLARGAIGKSDSFYAMVLGKEWYAPWDPGDNRSRAFDDTSLPLNQMWAENVTSGGMLHLVAWAAARRGLQRYSPGPKGRAKQASIVKRGPR